MSRSRIRFSHVVDVVEALALAERFTKACDRNITETILSCLKEGVDPNHVKNGIPVLHRVIRMGYIEATKILLVQSTIDINKRSSLGHTPLHIAAKKNRIQITVLLLQNGANPNISDLKQNTPLHHAITWRHYEIVHILLCYEANANVDNCFGKTPLYIAAVDLACLILTELLINFGASINWNKGVILPILLECVLCCSSWEHLEVAQYLLRRGADVDIQDVHTQQTALHMVALTGYLPAAKLLMNWGANSKLKDVNSFTAKDIALRHRHHDIVEELNKIVTFPVNQYALNI